MYLLYKQTEDGFVRVAKSPDPKELDAIVYPPEDAPVEKITKKLSRKAK